MRINQFQYAAPSKHTLAARLLTNPRSVSQPIAVTRRSLEPVFSAPSSQAVLATPTPWALDNGNGLSGLRGFGALNGVTVVRGLLSFSEDWTYSDFMGDANWLKAIASKCGLDPRYEGGLSYTPPSGALITQVNAKWTKLEEIRPVNEAVDTFMTGVESTVKAAATGADGLVRMGQDALCGKRTNEVESQRIAYFNTIKGALAQVMAFSPPAAGPAGSGGGSTGSGGSGGQTLDELVAAARRQARAQQAAQDAAQNSGAATAAPPSNPYLMPMLVFGGLAVVGVGITLMRRK